MGVNIGSNQPKKEGLLMRKIIFWSVVGLVATAIYFNIGYFIAEAYSNICKQGDNPITAFEKYLTADGRFSISYLADECRYKNAGYISNEMFFVTAVFWPVSGVIVPLVRLAFYFITQGGLFNLLGLV